MKPSPDDLEAVAASAEGMTHLDWPQRNPAVPAGEDSNSPVQGFIGDVREIEDLLERHRKELRSALAADGERRLAEVTERFVAERSELERLVAETRSVAEVWVEGVRENHAQQAQVLFGERVEREEVEDRLAGREGELAEALGQLERLHAELDSERERFREFEQQAAAAQSEAEETVAATRSKAENWVLRVRQHYQQLAERERAKADDALAEARGRAEQANQRREELETRLAELAGLDPGQTPRRD